MSVYAQLAMKTRKASRKTTARPAAEPRYSRTQAPAGLAPEAWQRGLRRQFGRTQPFGLENLGDEPWFSEFRIANPASGSSYRVTIRGTATGDNTCTCQDYRTNELGTCKHIEFTLGRLLARRGAKGAFQRGFQPPYSELILRNEGRRRVHFRAGSDCPNAIRAAAAGLFDSNDRGALVAENFDALAGFVAAVAASGHELRADDAALDFVAGRRDAAQRAALLDRLYPEGAADPGLTNLLKVPIYPYQAEGAWFAVRAGRALIGDEMGLGKTIQAIAAAELLARHCGVTKVLVICPTSLKYQWRSEIERFSGRAARILIGGRVQRQQDFRLDDFCKITNYEKLKLDLEAIAGWAPDLVIVDEAQRIKNWNTIAARALKRIASPYALVLTGTPLENKLEELISIVQFVDQHRLGPTWKLLHEHQLKDDAGRVTGYARLDRIGQSLAPIMIRRRKAQVLQQLPARTDQNLLLPMTAPQLELHAENADTVARIVQRWRRMKFLSESDQRRLTCALQNMRMSCNSTWLLDQQTDHGVKADELAALLDELFVDPQAKAVVFSQWTRSHEIVIRRLQARGIGYVSFHGGVASERRPQLVERFRDDPDCRVFLSTDAGSSGLNLQHASTLINLDLPWNPAILEQRIGRIHRMGQKRPVRIVNFVAKGSIEEGMLAVLAFKRSLAAGILDGGVGEIALGGSRLNRFMKDVENVTARMGEGEAVAAAEEVGMVAAAEPANTAEEVAPAIAAPPREAEDEAEQPPVGDPQAVTADDPWAPLLQVGVQLLGAFAAAEDPRQPSHPWIERDPASGSAALKIPLPPPQTRQRLAGALAELASALRGWGA